MSRSLTLCPCLLVFSVSNWLDAHNLSVMTIRLERVEKKQSLAIWSEADHRAQSIPSVALEYLGRLAMQ